ncbi:hypothetical protein AHAS_Ahas05G0229100 [Arachis hypogaea]
MLASVWMIRVNNGLRIHCRSVPLPHRRCSSRYDGDEGRNRGDAEVAVVAPLAAFLHNPLDVQELKASKEELRVEKLKDKEEVENLTQEMAELLGMAKISDGGISRDLPIGE